MKRISIALGAGLAALAASAAQPGGGVVVLETPIKATADAGDLVVFRDRQCRYIGRLVREPRTAEGVAPSLLKAVGADTGQWYAAVTQRVCDQAAEAVHMRVDLPRAPGLAGGGGWPPAPAGYEAGGRFKLVTN